MKEKIRKQYENLDPLNLLKNLEKLQDKFWQYAWKPNDVAFPIKAIQNLNNTRNVGSMLIANIPSQLNVDTLELNQERSLDNPDVTPALTEFNNMRRYYRQTHQAGKKRLPRTYRTRKDPFETVWSELELKLALNLEQTAKNLLTDLMKQKPEQFSIKLLRTLQRRVAHWRKHQIKIYQENRYKNITAKDNVIEKFISLSAYAVEN